VTGRQVTSPCDVTSSSLSPLTEDTSELGVQLTVGRRLKHIAMKATFDQPRNKDSQAEVKSSEFYASKLLGSFIVQDRQLHSPAPTVLQAVEVPMSTLIVVESPFRHTVHYISADQLHDDGKLHVSPSSASNSSSKLSTSSSSSSSSDSHSSSSSDSGLQASMFQSAETDTDIAGEPLGLIDVMSPDSADDRTVADLSDLDELREADLLPLPLCSESPFYLGLSDDELRRILVEPDCSGAPLDDVDELISAAELSWPSPSAVADTSAGKSDYCTPEVVELLGSVYDDWLRHDPDTASFFSPT